MFRKLALKLIMLLFVSTLFYEVNGQQDPNSLSFDGTDDYVNLGNSSLLRPTDELFIEAWVYLNNWNATTTQYIISNADTAGYYFKVENGSLIAGVYRNGSFGEAIADVSSLTGWHHVAMYFDGEFINLYVDASMQNYDDAGGYFPIEYNTNNNTVIGANYDGNSGFLNGQIDELKIWSVSRSISAATMNIETNPSTSGLVAYYRFNQGIAGGDNTAITTVTDLSVNALHGTLVNFGLNGSSSNFVAGKALRPINQASMVSPTDNQSNQITFSWTRPGTNKGGNGIKVFMKANATSGSATPIDGTNYTANSVFGSGQQIGTSGWYCVYDGTGTSATVTGLNAGTAYRIHVFEYQLVVGQPIRYCTSTATSNPLTTYTLFPAPTTQASNLVFSNITTSSMQINWTRGNGSNCIVFVKQTNTGEPTPVDRTTYSASSVFGSGSQIGTTGWYCVYKGTGTSVTVTGLNAGQTYRVMVLEYNGPVGFESYQTSTSTGNPANQMTQFSAPTIQASQIIITDLSTSGASVYLTRGNGNKVAIFMAQATSGTAQPVDNTTYTANSSFGDGDQIGSTGWYCVYNGTDNYVYVSNLQVATTYRVMACEYNGNVGEEVYNTSTATDNPVNFETESNPPTTQATDVSFSSITSNSATASWTRGDGQYCAAFIYLGTTGSASPLENSTYAANAAYGLGTQIGSSGWYCVYNGTGNTVNLTGLSSNKTYRLSVIEYNGSPGHEKYLNLTASNNPSNFTTLSSGPTVQASNITFPAVGSDTIRISWTRGNGANCIVFAKIGNSGTALPVDGTTYTANEIFQNGTQIGSTGWYCIYKGTGNTVTMRGLIPNTSYQVMVCEFNGSAGSEQYNSNTASNNPRYQLTDFATPTAQASNVSFSNVTNSSFTVSWTNGNGSTRAVFIKAGTDGTASPVNGTTYTPNTQFGSGTQIGTTGWYCIYNGTGNSVNVTGLTTLTTYRVMVCEYNGTAGKQKYNINTSSNNPANQTTTAPSSITQASNISYSSVTNNSFTVSWTRGNGSACAVFVRNAYSGTAIPLDNTTYTASSTFGAGDQIGTSGWYCVYNGTGNSVTVTGLSSASIYNVMVCEYVGSSGSETYATNTATNNPRSQLTTPYTTWSGTSWSNGSPDANTAAVIAGNFSEATNVVCKTLIINSNITMLVQPGNTLTVYTDLVNNGTLRLVSPNNMNAAGSLITYGNITNNKTMIAERYITQGTLDPSNYEWHFTGSPVGEFQVQTVFLGDYVYEYNESSNTWVSLKTQDLIRNGKGYMVKTLKTGGKVITYRGTFNTGSISYNLTNTFSSADYGYNLVTNPYPSAIDWNASSGWTKTNISNTIWIWNSSTSNYATWNGFVGVNGGSRYIPACQAFMVKVNDGVSSGTLAMNNNVRVHSSQSSMRYQSDNIQLIRLVAENNEGYNDETVVFNGMPNLTANKLFSPNPNVPQIYSNYKGRDASILAVDKMYDKLSIPIAYRLAENSSGENQITVNELTFDTSEFKLFLVDKVTNDTVPVIDQMKYTFYSMNNESTRWFELVFYRKNASSTIVNQIDNSQKIRVWSFSNKVFVDLPFNKHITVGIYNMLGEKILHKSINRAGITTIELIKGGIYIVKIDGEEQLVKKIFIQK